MPVSKSKDRIGSFARWGDSGKKYYYDPENEASLARALDKAKAQGAAINAGSNSTKTFNLNDMNLNRTLFLFDQFRQDSAEKLVKELLELDAEATDDINILINSFGGYTSALTAILDTISNLKSNVNTICLGEADSCGAVLLASGNNRFIGEKSRTMIHEVGTLACGKISDIEVALEDAKAVNRTLINVLSSKTEQDEEMLASIMKNDTFLDSKESVEFGLVDNLIEGEEEFLEENVTENMKVNFHNMDTFILNKVKEKISNLALKQGKQKIEGESVMPIEKTNENKQNEKVNTVEEQTVEDLDQTVELEDTDETIEKDVENVKINENTKNDLVKVLSEMTKNPEQIIAFLDEQARVNKENSKKLAEFEAKERKRNEAELAEFVSELRAENKILPSEMGLVQPILNSLDNVNEIEYSYSQYGVKEKDTALGIFKKLLSNLPNRGLFGQVSEMSDDYDYDKAVEHFSQKLFKKSHHETNAKEHLAIVDAMKNDPKAQKLL